MAAAVASSPRALAQGCVAIHGSGISTAEDTASDSSNNPALTGGTDSNPWAISVDYRYFNSIHDYIGRTENARIGTGVYNKSNFTDFGLTYIFDPRWSATLTLPFVVNDRSQTTNGLRYHTDAVGIGDASIEVNYWVFDPLKHPRGNILLGLGLSTPTGNDHAMGEFLSYNKTINAYTAKSEPVDQSIEPGTGGWGIILDLYAYHELPPIEGLNAYVSGTYETIPFQDTNGVPTYRGNPYEAITGITDNYLYRAGLEYKLFPRDGIAVSWGLRMEGVPVKNWFGDSAGFRRPGYSIDWEPGASWSHKNYSFRLYVPFSILHDRTQSLADQEDTVLTGKYQHGDAFFANYEIITSFSIKL
ncbi:MAG TPA: hypothetical protein VIJ19_10915 [Opitutaceae bacterium]